MESRLSSEEERLEAQNGRVVAAFTITELPLGSVEESIRREWIGMTLPVREIPFQIALGTDRYFDAVSCEHVDNSEGVPVVGAEAIGALQKAGRTEAAEFWDRIGIHTTDLIFRASEGTLEFIPKGDQS